MSDDGETPIISPNIGTGAQADRSVQELRLDFTQELRELRTILTGRIKKGNNEIILFHDAPLCEEHFNRLMHTLFLPVTKAITLSRIRAETASEFVIAFGDQLQAWITTNCLTCPSCGIKTYGDVSPLVLSIESFFYGNFFRAVDGWEADKLSTMQHVTTTEAYVRSEQPKGFMRWLKR